MSKARLLLERISLVTRLLRLLGFVVKQVWVNPARAKKVSALFRLLKKSLAYDSADDYDARSVSESYPWIDCVSRTDSDFENGDLVAEVRLIGDNITRSIGHTALGMSQRFIIQQLNLDKKVYVTMANEFGNKHYYGYWSEFSPCLRTLPSLSRIAEITSPNLWENIESISCFRKVMTVQEATSVLFYRWFVQENKNSILTISNSDLERGYSWMKRQGISESDWYVVLHNRWTKEGLANPRNNSIEDYIPAIRWITNLGGFVIKVGLADGQAIRGLGRQYIDYSNSEERCEELDIFLLATSKYMLACSSGPVFVATSFGIPTLHLNFTDLGRMAFYPKSLVVPKLRIHRNARRRGKFSEALQSGLYDGDFLKRSSAREFEFRANTSDEILSAVQEFHSLVTAQSWRALASQDDMIQGLIKSRTGYSTTKVSKSFSDKHSIYFS